MLEYKWFNTLREFSFSRINLWPVPKELLFMNGNEDCPMVFYTTNSYITKLYKSLEQFESHF